MVEQIKIEISTMKLVKHPNILQLFEVMASKTKIYFVLEYVTGGELFNQIAQHGKLKEDDARKYFQQLINAVDYCHSRGVYHRDLKPENLLLDSKGNLKISDFGLSALSQQVKEDELLHTVCGTPNYVAPEVIMDKGYDGAKADLWSCGVILFVLMAGYLPFDEPNIIALYKKIYRADFTCPKWFSPGARKLILRILEPNPKYRITIPQMLESSWFKKGYNPVKFEEERDTSLDDIDAVFSDSVEHLVMEQKELKGGRPSLMNAFDIISLSKGLNLSGLFEKKQSATREARFTSKHPATEIITKMEESVKPLGFNVKRRDYKMRFQGSETDLCMTMGSPSELTLGCRLSATSYSSVLKAINLASDQFERTRRLDEYLKGLEDERRKIEAFKRALPYCMHLLNDAIAASKEQLADCQPSVQALSVGKKRSY
eukprot:PITA_14224